MGMDQETYGALKGGIEGFLGSNWRDLYPVGHPGHSHRLSDDEVIDYFVAHAGLGHMKGDLCGKILSRGIEQQNAVGLEKISVDRDAAPLIHPLSLILSPCPYAIGRRNSSRTGYPSCGQVHPC